jgi:hypothetical protein
MCLSQGPSEKAPNGAMTATLMASSQPHRLLGMLLASNCLPLPAGTRLLSTLRVRQSGKTWQMSVSKSPALYGPGQPWPQPDTVSTTETPPPGGGTSPPNGAASSLVHWATSLVRRSLLFLLPSGYPSSVGRSYTQYCAYTALASVFASCNGGASWQCTLQALQACDAV